MAYTSNRENGRVFGDIGTGVWVAPKGTTLPTTLTEDPEGFEPFGWLSDDGIQRSVEKDVQEYNALQGGSLIRKKVSTVTQTYTFTCLEESALVLGLVNSGQEITVTGTGAEAVARQNINEGQNVTVERALVIDAVDGDIRERTVLSAVDITFQGEVAIAHNEDMRMYEFEASLLAGAEAYVMSNAPGVTGVVPGA